MKWNLCLAGVFVIAAVAGAPVLADVTYTSTDMVGWTWDYYDTTEPIGASFDNTTKEDPATNWWLTIHLPEDGVEDPPGTWTGVNSNRNDNNPILSRVGLGIDDALTDYTVETHVDFVNGGGRRAGVIIFQDRSHMIEISQQDGRWLLFSINNDAGNFKHIFSPWSDPPGGFDQYGDWMKMDKVGSVLSFWSKENEADPWTARNSVDLANPPEGWGTFDWFLNADNSALNLGLTNMTWDVWPADRDAHFEYITISDGGAGPGDVDGNGVVDGLDLTAVLTAWETTPGDPLWNENADLDDNNVVDGLDLTEVISNWTTASAASPEPASTKTNRGRGNVKPKKK